MAHAQLCSICTEIDFEKYLHNKIEQPISLGSWSSISQRFYCAFCRLVVHCLKSRPHLIPRNTDPEILLQNQLSWVLGVELSPYDRSRSESYSNKYDLRSSVGKCPTDAYRFLVYANSVGDSTFVDDQKQYGIIQCLGPKEPLNVTKCSLVDKFERRKSTWTSSDTGSNYAREVTTILARPLVSPKQIYQPTSDWSMSPIDASSRPSMPNFRRT